MDRELLIRIALEQLLAKLDCSPSGAPGPGWLENHMIRKRLGSNTTATQDEAISELKNMLGITP